MFIKIEKQKPSAVSVYSGKRFFVLDFMQKTEQKWGNEAFLNYYFSEIKQKQGMENEILNAR